MLQAGEKRPNRAGPEPLGAILAAKQRPEPPSVSDEDRAVLRSYVEEFAREFNDRAAPATSTSRAVHLLERSGVGRDAFIQRMYEARALTRDRRDTVRNRMSFFFAVLEDLLRLRAPGPSPQPRHSDSDMPVAT